MKKTFHLCLASHDEVMFRSEADLNHGFNCLAVAAIETDTRVLAEAHLTTHFHTEVQTECVTSFMKQRRYAYTRYFNAKYHRKGRLGEKNYFQTELIGNKRISTCAYYIMRQGIHHGLSETAFAYEHCSANAIYRKELGKATPGQATMPAEKRYAYLPDERILPVAYRMNENGLLLREDIIDYHYVEDIIHTPQNFLFNMNRKLDNKWVDEQLEEDENAIVITPELLEQGVQMETVPSNPRTRMLSDLEMCALIDNYFVRKYKKGSDITIYDLSVKGRQAIGNDIWHCFRENWATLPKQWRIICQGAVTTTDQIRRCVVI